MPSTLHAGFFRRCGAGLYDSFILIALYMSLTAFLLIPSQGQAIPAGTFSFQLLLFLLTGCFYSYFWRKNGQTIGMLAWHCRVCAHNGSTLTLKQAWIRYTVMLLGLACGGLGMIWCLLDKQKRGWHDIAAKTMVEKLASKKS